MEFPHNNNFNKTLPSFFIHNVPVSFITSAQDITKLVKQFYMKYTQVTVPRTNKTLFHVISTAMKLVLIQLQYNLQLFILIFFSSGKLDKMNTMFLLNYCNYHFNKRKTTLVKTTWDRVNKNFSIMIKIKCLY